MSKIDEALGRLGQALDSLEQAFDAAGGVAPAPDEETARLHEEIRVLKTRAAEDARLRAEAAGAVREALRDLRGAMARGRNGEQANA